MIKQKTFKLFLLFAVLVILAYGGGRLYYAVTAGFVESNIMYDIPKNPRWNTSPLSSSEKESLKTILSQPFTYLAKGCQSYVFSSKDGQYVIKFFKFQRFRPQAWLDNFAFIPLVDSYRLKKIEKKRRKLENVLNSWKLAYEELQPETGVVYVHLNKTAEIDQELIAYDKMGFEHRLQLGGIEFMLQKKTEMLCPTLVKYRDNGDLTRAKELIDKLFAMLLSEYERGLADNDHALMQNTGVYNNQPIHIDVGQFVKNPVVTDTQIRNQELFNKTWKFRIWLQENYPAIADYTKLRLKEIIGDSFDEMKPNLYKSSVGRIPNVTN